MQPGFFGAKCVLFSICMLAGEVATTAAAAA
jgi:hypothetical protein